MTNNPILHAMVVLLVFVAVMIRRQSCGAFSIPSLRLSTVQQHDRPLKSNWNDNNNNWKSPAIDDTKYTTENNNNLETIPTSGRVRTMINTVIQVDDNDDEDDDNDNDNEAEIMLDTLAVLQAEESVYNAREAQRADTIRRMEEWGFDSSTIAASTLDGVVATTDVTDVVVEDNMQLYREESYIEDMDVDLATVESHTKVPKDDSTNEPIRSQAVYVDEHSCIGCTNCAMIAQSTFFMEEENGKARVFEQWGDDDTTIDIAMDTCPVNCIHYIPYDELVQLEIKRRTQFINVVGGLANRAERGSSSGMSSFTPRSFGGKSFTNAPKVSRGYDKTNPEFVAKETLRILTARRKKLEQERRSENKMADL